jgi:RHS repeat-associated protein
VRWSEGTPLDQGYCGSLQHRRDAESGLVYMRARYYEPWTGRFISEDPARDGQNWFVYASSNPIHFADADGRYTIPASLFNSLLMRFLADSAISVQSYKVAAATLVLLETWMGGTGIAALRYLGSVDNIVDAQSYLQKRQWLSAAKAGFATTKPLGAGSASPLASGVGVADALSTRYMLFLWFMLDTFDLSWD